MNPLRILLVDDSAEFLESAARLLMLHQELCIVGRAASGSSALEQVAVLNPDLVPMDLSQNPPSARSSCQCLPAYSLIARPAVNNSNREPANHHPDRR